MPELYRLAVFAITLTSAHWNIFEEYMSILYNYYLAGRSWSLNLNRGLRFPFGSCMSSKDKCILTREICYIFSIPHKIYDLLY